jgi:hypothetical protein
MNEEALVYSYDLFKKDGYNGTLEDYKELIQSNPEALNYSYDLFKKDGYADSIEDFESLVGLKKKDDTALPSEDGLSEPQDSEFVKKFKSTGLATLSNLTRVPAYIQEQIATVAAAFDPELKETLDNMSFEEREAALGTFASLSGQLTPLSTAAGTEVRKASEDLRKKSNEIADTFKQYDQTITEDISDLKLGQATARLFSEVGGAIPSIIQAFIPGIGIASIGAGAAAEESRALQEEGEKLGLKTSSTAALYGAAEGALEAVTKGIGKRFFKVLSGKSDQFIKSTVREFVKRTTKDFAAEGASETGTDLLQNLTDYAIQGDEKAFDKKWQEYADIFIIGGIATAPISGATQGVSVTKQTLEKRAIDRKLETSKYDDLVSMFGNPEIDRDTEDLAVPQTKKFLKFELDQKVEAGDITRAEADQALKNYEDATYIKNEFNGLEIPEQNRSKVAALLLEKRDLKSKIAGKEPALVSKEIERFNNIDDEIKVLLEEAPVTETAPVEEVPVEEVVATETPVEETVSETVGDIINRPVVLTALGGSTLDTPIRGDLYLDGEQVVVEDANGNITEIGNFDEIAETNIEDIGIEYQTQQVNVNRNGSLTIDEKSYTIQEDLPTQGLVFDQDGNVIEASVKDETGKPVMFKGTLAEEIAYQVLLNKATSPEQSQRITELLDKDEEFQNILREATEPTQETTDTDIEQVAEQAEEVVDVETESERFIESVGQKPLFQKEQAVTDESDTEAITEEMNNLSDERAEFDVPSNLTTKNKTNVKSLKDRFGDTVKVIKDMSFFEGVPFMFTISDQLTAGKWSSPFTGKTFDFYGGIGFNMVNPGNAWANVTENTANQTISTAKGIYEKNKELFDRLWSEGKLPNGHIPMAVIKMGQNSIESNEALFRIISDNITTNFNEAQRVEAKNILDQEIAKKNPSEKVTDFLSKYTTIDQVLDNITELPLTSRAEVRSLVMYGSPSMGSPTKPGTPNSPVLRYLLEGRDVSDRALFHLPTINDSVREESTKNIPDGHIISVVGVDVLNPSVTSVANGDFVHQNYGFGVKGQLIGVIEKPSHAADIFPEMYSKSVRMFKEDKKGVLPSPKKAVDQAVAASGAVAITKAFKGASVSTKMSTMNVVLGKLRQAFPSVTVVNTKQEFDAVVNSPSVKKYSRDGEIIYGFTLDGRVFLNPDIATTNTAIHEYGHVWLNFIEEFNPALLKKGFDLLNGTDILAEKIKIHGDNRTARMEALADLIGNRGESLVNAAQKSRFKNWLNAVFTYVKSKFKAFNDISAEDFQNLNLDQFVDGILSDLLSGKEVTSKQVRSVEVQFQKADTKNLIDRGISEGFSKEAIKLGLEKLGYDTSNFNKEFSDVRESFEDIQEKASEPKKVKVDDIWDKSDKAIKDKLKSKGVDYYKTKTRELLLDRQTRIKRLLNGIGSREAQKAANLLVTKAGGSGYANFRFEKADKKIFKGLSVEDKKTLDQIVYARRIDAINENRKSRGLESYVGVEGFSQEDAKRELNEIRQNVGEDKFRDLSSRATEYFKVFDESLKRMRDADLISEDVYNQLKDTEYSPIKTIKYLIPDDYDANETDRMAQITGMPKSAIQSLSDSNVNDIIMDSRWLLETNVSMIEARVFENRMLNSFYDAIQSADTDQKKAINEYVKDNPQEGTYKTGRPKYKYDTVKTPVGFVRVPFMRNGNKVEMIISEPYAKQLLDIKTTPSLLERTLPKLTGTSILRFFATSGNPLFIIGNTAVDFANILFLSDVYSKNKFVGGAKLAADSIKTFLSKIGGTDAYNKAYKEYMEHGGSMDYLSTDGLKAIQSINPKNKFLDASTSALRDYGRFMSYLGETSEISFRLAVYEKSKDNQLKEFKKLNKREPGAQEMEDIMFAAAREARETIDFSQGGSLVKAGDKVLPYLNAATQGFRKAVDYAENNPAVFASSMVQGAIMSGSIAALSMFMLLRSLGEDEDEEKVLDVLNSISDYEKANYHIIFTGNKDEDGEYQYVRVKKLPTISLVATLAENLTTKAILKSRGIDYDVDESILLKNVEAAAPIVPTPKNLLSRNPLVSAVVTYQFNHDMFYDQEVFRGPANKKIDPAAEGAFDNRVDQMYKDLAPFFGLSPKRTKAAMEKIITSETTNPMIGLLYSGYDVAFKDGTQIGDEIKIAADRTLKSSSKKLVRKTNSELIRYKQEDLVEKEKIEVDTERYLAEQKMYSEIKKRYKDEKGTFTNEEFVNLIKENFEPMDYKKYAKKYTAYIKNINSDPAILDIIYEDTPEIQAKMIFNKFGDSFEKEEIDAIKKVYNASGRKFSKKGLLIYNRDYKKK